jgi:thiol-disulfide isomerase/thioredoxin
MDNPLDNDGLAAQPAPKPAPVSAADTPIAEPIAEPKGHGGGKPPKKRANTWLYVAIVAVVLAAAGGGAFYFATNMKLPDQVKAGPSEEAAGPLKAYATGSIAHLVTYADRRTVADVPFVDRDRKPLKLSDFKGQVVVLNVWATWCAPCRFEMPTLANLQRDYAGKGVKVLPLSVDEEPKFDDVKSFIDVQEPLEVYVDTKFAAPTKLQVQGMPATLIIDKQGRAVARLDGEATWDTPEVKALIDKLLAE